MRTPDLSDTTGQTASPVVRSFTWFLGETKLSSTEKVYTQSINSLLLPFSINSMAKKNAKSKQRRNLRVSRNVSPPQINTGCGVRNYTIRYRVITGIETTYDIGLLAQSCFLVYATVTTVNTIMQSFRLKSLECWCSSAADTTARTIAMGFTSTPGTAYQTNVRLMQKEDTAFGVSDVAHVKLIPPKNSAFSWWFSTQGYNSPGKVQLSLPTGSVLDMTFDADFALPSNAATPAAPPTISVSSPTPRTGLIYFGLWDVNVQPQGVLRIA